MGSWTNPNIQQVQALATTGSLSGAAAATLAGGSTYTPVNLVNVSQFASYDVNTYIFCPTQGNVSAPIVAEIQLQWFDDLVSGIPVFEEDWWIWVNRAFSAGFTSAVGCGPMHGTYLTVNITLPNASAAQPATIQYFNMYGSARPVPYSDWRQNLGGIPPSSNGISVQTPSNSPTSFENVLANLSGVSIPINATLWMPCGLYAGPAYFRGQSSAALGANLIIAHAEGLVSGQITTGGGNQNILVNQAVTAETEIALQLPRVPCFIAIKGAAAAVTLSFQLIAQQAA